MVRRTAGKAKLGPTAAGQSRGWYSVVPRRSSSSSLPTSSSSPSTLALWPWPQVLQVEHSGERPVIAEEEEQGTVVAAVQDPPPGEALAPPPPAPTPGGRGALRLRPGAVPKVLHDEGGEVAPPQL